MTRKINVKQYVKQAKKALKQAKIQCAKYFLTAEEYLDICVAIEQKLYTDFMQYKKERHIDALSLSMNLYWLSYACVSGRRTRLFGRAAGAYTRGAKVVICIGADAGMQRSLALRFFLQLGAHHFFALSTAAGYALAFFLFLMVKYYKGYACNHCKYYKHYQHRAQRGGY